MKLVVGFIRGCEVVMNKKEVGVEVLKVNVSKIDFKIEFLERRDNCFIRKDELKLVIGLIGLLELESIEKEKELLFIFLWLKYIEEFLYFLVFKKGNLL